MKIQGLLLFSLFSLSLFAQNIDPTNIQIVRDKWGVPHIFSKTDAEAAYGLAWAHAEDNFEDIQTPLLGVRRLLAEVDGKEGALLDAVGFLFKVDEIVEEKYESTFSPKFKKIIGAYVQGLNEYATKHPKEVRHKKLFPLTEKDVIKGYVLIMSFISNIQYDLIRVFEDKLDPVELESIGKGSNGFAYAPSKTTTGKTYLISNSHQPLEGSTAWYELSIHSEEGWEFAGATFAGGLTPFVGTNPDLGWTHCVNYNDFHDVFRLEMNPENEHQYLMDGEWLELEERVLKMKVKVGFLKIPIKRKFYWSVYGPTVKNKTGFYSLRFPSNMVIGQAEQWSHMNKARNYEEFYKAMEMQQLASLVVVYADKEGNIMFADQGLFPERNPAYDYKKIVPGNTKETLWEAKFRPLEELIIVENPACGYVFNANNTGLNCTCDEENPSAVVFSETKGWQQHNTSRSIRFKEMMKDYDKLSYEDIKRLKYDGKFHFPLYHRSMENLDFIRQINPADYPDLKAVINRVKQWNGETNSENKQAAIISLTIQALLNYLIEKGSIDQNGDLPEEEYIKALRYAQKHLLKHFGTLDITLGDLQRHVRGDKDLPVGGLPETLTSMYTKPYKNGRMESTLGESFILFATYGEDGVEKIETINCYGASNHPDSPHYNDQMEPYIKKELKEMTLDKERIFKEGVRVYRLEK